MINFYLFFKNLNKKFYSNLANDKRVKILTLLKLKGLKILFQKFEYDKIFRSSKLLFVDLA